MNKKQKRLLKFSGAAAALIILSSCTASFCSPVDTGNLYYNIDNGLVTRTVVVEGVESQVLDFNDNLKQIRFAAADAGYTVPSMEYYEKLDDKVLDFAVITYKEKYPETTLSGAELNETALDKFGYLKFVGTYSNKENTEVTSITTGNDLFANMKLWNKQIADENPSIGLAGIPDNDYFAFYKKEMKTRLKSFRSCISLVDGEYGNGDNRVSITKKSWGYAFSRGPIEGLLVYPVAAMIEGFTRAFGAGGWGQMGAIIVVTLIVRLILLLLTFKSTLGTQKMQLLQPELAKIQQKYPNAEKNQYEKQLLTQAQMALYKKNKINPMGSLLVMVVQFPIFIGVWGAMTGAASLSSDAVLGLNLDAVLGTSMTSGWFSPGWWTAVVLFILMAVSQFISMKITTWLSKSKTKKVAKTGVNESLDKQAKQNKWMTIIMFGMILFMSWTLPAAMGVYWFIGAIISTAQSIVMHLIMNRRKK